MKKILWLMVMSIASLIFLTPGNSAAVEFSSSGTIYVPIYRNFYYGLSSSREASGLTSTICLHNTDPKQTITVNAIEYHESNGKLQKSLISGPIEIKPWSSKEIGLLPEMHTEDFGANLIVRWKSDQPANPLLVEVLMVGQILNRGVSFLTQGQEIKE